MQKDGKVDENTKSEMRIYVEFDQLDKQLLNESLKKISK